jgi:hypothetical protein
LFVCLFVCPFPFLVFFSLFFNLLFVLFACMLSYELLDSVWTKNNLSTATPPPDSSLLHPNLRPSPPPPPIFQNSSLYMHWFHRCGCLGQNRRSKDSWATKKLTRAGGVDSVDGVETSRRGSGSLFDPIWDWGDVMCGEY